MKKYKVGNGTEKIKLSVDITTIGLAASRAIVINLASSEPGVSVGHSENATGDIPQKKIGSANALKGKRLSVLTRIEIFGNEEERKSEADRLTAKYTLDDGDDGHQLFEDPKKAISDDYSTVILSFKIDLTA